MNDKIDIIMPNYNKGDYLKEAILSVINQSYKNWKLYIIDDNSNDSSKKIIKKFKKNKKIKIFLLKKNHGPGYCRNLGLNKSKSNLVAFIDSDDSWKKNKLDLQIKFMKRNNVQFTYTDYITFYQIGKRKKILGKSKVVKFLNFNSFTKNTSINTSTMMITRKLLKDVRFKNLKKLEDYIFKCNLFKKNPKLFAVKFPRCLAFYRLTKKSRSGSKLQNIKYLWQLNKKFNNFNFIENLVSILMVSINSYKKYGLKLGV